MGGTLDSWDEHRARAAQAVPRAALRPARRRPVGEGAPALQQRHADRRSRGRAREHRPPAALSFRHRRGRDRAGAGVHAAGIRRGSAASCSAIRWPASIRTAPARSTNAPASPSAKACAPRSPSRSTSPGRPRSAIAPRYETYRARYLASDPVSFGMVNRMLGRTDARPLVKDIRYPTMIVAGRFDQVRPPAGSEEFARAIPGARFELIDACHMMPAQAPDLLLPLIEDFLATHTPAAAWAGFTRRRDAMRIKANGIDLQLPGRRARGRAMAHPVELARDQPRHVGRAGERARQRVPRAALRSARPRADRGAGGPLHVRPPDRRRDRAARCAVDPQGSFRRPVDGRRHGLGLAQRHPDRIDRIIVCDSPCASTPATTQQWKERIAVAREKGMEALVEPTVGRWFPPETPRRQSALPRPRAADDPHHPGERLRRLRGGARGSRLPLQGRHRDASGPVHRRREGRHHAGRDAADARDASGLAVRRSAGRRPYLQPRPAGGVQSGGAGVPAPEVRKAAELHGSGVPATALQTPGADYT